MLNKFITGVQYTTLEDEKKIVDYLESIKNTDKFTKQNKDFLKACLADSKNIKDVKVGINFRDIYSETVVRYKDEKEVFKTSYKETYDYLKKISYINE